MMDYLTRVTEIKHLTLTVVELHVQLVAPESITFHAGQSMQIKTNHEFKSYSVASPPQVDNSFLIFCIEIIPDRNVAGWFHKLKVADTLEIRGPEGKFVVDNLETNIVFACEGIGVAPFASIIPDLLNRNFAQRATLLFESKSEEDFFYYDKFSRLKRNYDNFKFLPMLRAPKSYWPGEVGRITTYAQSFYEKYKDDTFYLAGRSETVLELQGLLLKLGHAAQKIKTEIFS